MGRFYNLLTVEKYRKYMLIIFLLFFVPNYSSSLLTHKDINPNDSVVIFFIEKETKVTNVERFILAYGNNDNHKIIACKKENEKNVPVNIQVHVKNINVLKKIVSRKKSDEKDKLKSNFSPRILLKNLIETDVIFKHHFANDFMMIRGVDKLLIFHSNHSGYFLVGFIIDSVVFKYCQNSIALITDKITISIRPPPNLEV